MVRIWVLGNTEIYHPLEMVGKYPFSRQTHFAHDWFNVASCCFMLHPISILLLLQYPINYHILLVSPNHLHLISHQKFLESPHLFSQPSNPSKRHGLRASPPARLWSRARPGGSRPTACSKRPRRKCSVSWSAKKPRRRKTAPAPGQGIPGGPLKGTILGWSRFFTMQVNC